MLTPAARKSLETILQHAREGKLGAQDESGCLYHSDGRFCAVGCLLTPEEHAGIDRMRKNAVNVQSLSESFPDLLDRIGLPLTSIQLLQDAHDRAYGRTGEYDPFPAPARFIEALEACLSADIFDHVAFQKV